MYENLVNQEAGKLLRADIKHNRLPGAVLFSGPEASGKLTAALETARILSCHQAPQGEWLCTCPSCLQHKSLICSNLMLMGRLYSRNFCCSKNFYRGAFYKCKIY